ncbi:hypothetical protein B0H34DRAFT_380323 [Crassisporium funariophilum]|nr:hypothetical protein B0H34DRAFT_380323 [Crassisporium funariophilum]
MSTSSSSSSVAGQPTQSLVTNPHTFKKRSTTLKLPLTPFPGCSWDSQDTDEPLRSDSSGCSSRTPTLSWDSVPDWSDFPDTRLRSMFEDWEDSPWPNSSVIIEEDGIQTLLIAPQSPFFQPPPSPRPFDHAPFSTGCWDTDVKSARHDDTLDELPPSAVSDMSPGLIKKVTNEGRVSKGTMLFIDTTSYSSLANTFALSASLFCSPRPADDMSWEPRMLMCGGPDVPIDCIYSAGDISPTEHWDEKLWSPVTLNPLRTAPCH